MKTFFRRAKTILPATLAGFLIASCDAAPPSKLAKGTSEQIWQSITNPVMGPQVALMAAEEICSGSLDKNKREAIEANLAKVDTPSPGFVYFGKMYLEGKCVDENRVLGDKLMRLGLMPFIPAVYTEVKLQGSPAKPEKILPFTLGTDMEAQLKAVAPTTDMMWMDEIRGWLAASPHDLADAAEKFRAGGYSFFQRDYAAPAPEAAVAWMYAAANTADDIDPVIRAIRWINDPALAPYWAAYTSPGREFTEEEAANLTHTLLYQLELRGLKPAMQLHHCLAFEKDDKPEWIDAEHRYIHLQQMKRQGIEVDDALLQHLQSLMAQRGKEEPFVPQQPDFYRLSLTPPILGHCGL